MEIKEYRTIDRANWPPGPWDGEPDKMQFPDESTGLPCLIVRQKDSGHLCGYVGVSAGHPLFGKSYGDEAVDALHVHGGVTFGDHCQEVDNESEGICHVPASPSEDGVWWLGFDCAHVGDLSHFVPIRGLKHKPDWIKPRSGEYCSLEYVRGECARLARQLAELSA